MSRAMFWPVFIVNQFWGLMTWAVYSLVMLEKGMEGMEVRYPLRLRY